MKDPNNREIMARLYRILEKYETPQPQAFEWVEDAQTYFSSLLSELQGLWDEYKGSSIASSLGMAMYNALQEAYQSRMTGKLKYREGGKE